MAYKVVLSDEAAGVFDELDKSVKNQIQKFFDRPTLKTNPKEFGKPLSYDLHGLWRYLVGDWRIISKIKDDVLIILVLNIAHRSHVYK